MFNNKLANVILAFVISIGLWCYVAYAVNPVQKQTFKNIPVQLVNEEVLSERGLAVANDTPVTVNVAVEGNRKVLASMDADSFTATADVSECIAGTNSVAVEIETNKNVNFASDDLLTVQVNVEESVTESRAVKIEYTGEAGSGREVEAELTGESVINISGAKSLVAKVAYVAADINVSDIKAIDQLINAELEPVDSSGNEVDNINISQKTVEVKASLYHTKKISLVINVTGEPASGYSYDSIKCQDTIMIRGSKSAIEDMTSVNADVDISGLAQNTEVELALDLPDGVELSSKAKAPVAQINIAKEASSSVSITGSNISIKNLDEDSYDAKVTSGNVKISVTGGVNVTEDDFVLSINVKGLDAGEHEVPLTVRYKGEGSVIAAPDTVTVRISAKE